MLDELCSEEVFVVIEVRGEGVDAFRFFVPARLTAARRDGAGSGEGIGAGAGVKGDVNCGSPSSSDEDWSVFESDTSATTEGALELEDEWEISA